MARRSIELAMVITLGNGDEGYRKVMKLPVPGYIAKMKGADEKDEELLQHVDHLKEWLLMAIKQQEREDARNGFLDTR